MIYWLQLELQRQVLPNAELSPNMAILEIITMWLSQGGGNMGPRSGERAALELQSGDLMV